MKTIPSNSALICGKEANTLKLREGYRVVSLRIIVRAPEGVLPVGGTPLNVTIPVVGRQFCRGVLRATRYPSVTSSGYRHLGPFGLRLTMSLRWAEVQAGEVVAPNRQTNGILFSFSQTAGRDSLTGHSFVGALRGPFFYWSFGFIQQTSS